MSCIEKSLPIEVSEVYIDFFNISMQQPSIMFSYSIHFPSGSPQRRITTFLPDHPLQPPKASTKKTPFFLLLSSDVAISQIDIRKRDLKENSLATILLRMSRAALHIFPVALQRLRSWKVERLRGWFGSEGRVSNSPQNRAPNNKHNMRNSKNRGTPTGWQANMRNIGI